MRKKLQDYRERNGVQIFTDIWKTDQSAPPGIVGSLSSNSSSKPQIKVIEGTPMIAALRLFYYQFIKLIILDSQHEQKLLNIITTDLFQESSPLDEPQDPFQPQQTPNLTEKPNSLDIAALVKEFIGYVRSNGFFELAKCFTQFPIIDKILLSILTKVIQQNASFTSFNDSINQTQFILQQLSSYFSIKFQPLHSKSTHAISRFQQPNYKLQPSEKGTQNVFVFVDSQIYCEIKPQSLYVAELKGKGRDRGNSEMGSSKGVSGRQNRLRGRKTVVSCIDSIPTISQIDSNPNFDLNIDTQMLQSKRKIDSHFHLNQDAYAHSSISQSSINHTVPPSGPTDLIQMPKKSDELNIQPKKYLQLQAFHVTAKFIADLANEPHNSSESSSSSKLVSLREVTHSPNLTTVTKPHIRQSSPSLSVSDKNAFINFLKIDEIHHPELQSNSPPPCIGIASTNHSKSSDSDLSREEKQKEQCSNLECLFTDSRILSEMDNKYSSNIQNIINNSKKKAWKIPANVVNAILVDENSLLLG